MPTNDLQAVPGAPKIYHILHVDNLPSLLQHGCLWSDAEMLRRGILCTTIGMNIIKKRRLEELEVKCYPGTKVGEYVPFNFCPRSVMLRILYYSNHPDLGYKGGQGPIVHLELDMNEAIAWADRQARRWAFSLSNAGAYYTDFYDSLNDLFRVNWAAVRANKWSGDGIDPSVKEGKQAEFLVQESVPWSLVRRIGVINTVMEQQVKKQIGRATHVPPVVVLPEWYY